MAGEVRCEPPNDRLDRFQGTLLVDGQTFALDNEQVLLRGCTVRNTQWCFGLVLYAGVRNAHNARLNIPTFNIEIFGF